MRGEREGGREEREQGIERFFRQMGELKVMHEQEFEELKLRHRSELRNKEDRFASDRQAWEENLLRSQQADFMTREREMRAKLREERDKVGNSSICAIMFDKWLF